MGGGVVMVPAMIFLLRMDPKLAVGTSMTIVIFTAISATIKHIGNNNIDWKIALPFMPAAIIGGWLGAQLVHQVSSDNLKKMFGAFLLLVGARMLFGK